MWCLGVTTFVLFDYTSSRAHDAPLRLLERYRGYVRTDDYTGIMCWRCPRVPRPASRDSPISNGVLRSVTPRM